MNPRIHRFDQFHTSLKTCLAIGNFDGVHCAHQQLINKMLEKARSTGAKSYALTFEPHPRTIISPRRNLILLQSFQRRYEALLALGLDGVIVADFTPSFSQIPPSKFIEELCSKITLDSVSVGFNFAFGKGAEGNPNTLKSLLIPREVECEIASTIMMDGVRVSSAFLREEVSRGKVETYLKLTGRYYLVEGTVVEGEKRGRHLGFPTANLEGFSSLLKFGVYVTLAKLEDGNSFPALVNYGSNPTFGDDQPKMEAHIPGLQRELYGEKLQLNFLKLLRPVLQFTSPNALKTQIGKDLIQMESVFQENTGNHAHSQFIG